MNPALAVSRFTSFGKLRPTDIKALMTLRRPIRRVERGQLIRRQNDDSPCLYLLHSGWAATSVRTRQGKRQILRVHLPGDLVGLPSIVLHKAYDTITALSSVEVSTIEVKALKSLFVDSPRLAAMLFAISQEERILLMDRLLAVGQLSAEGRVASLVLELHRRLVRNGRKPANDFDAPLSQAMIGDLLGLTAVHVNRTLAALRETQILFWKNGVVRISNEQRLCQLAESRPIDLAYEPEWLPD